MGATCPLPPPVRWVTFLHTPLLTSRTALASRGLQPTLRLAALMRADTFSRADLKERQRTRTTPSTNNRTPWMVAHSLRATAWSRSTSCDGGSCPSDPCPPRRPSNDAANDLAAAHEMIPYQRSLHACYSRRCVSRGSDRARALANSRRKMLASSDHLPPTSKARTTRRARAPSPTNSGGRSLLISASCCKSEAILRLFSLVPRRPRMQRLMWCQLPTGHRCRVANRPRQLSSACLPSAVPNPCCARTNWRQPARRLLRKPSLPHPCPRAC